MTKAYNEKEKKIQKDICQTSVQCVKNLPVIDVPISFSVTQG